MTDPTDSVFATGLKMTSPVFSPTAKLNGVAGDTVCLKLCAKH